MADRAISELLAANQVTPSDLFVLEQSGTAKKLTGQTLENWLLSFADGHGGIQSIVKQGTSGLNDTYRITFADTTTFDFVVTNGKAISSVNQTSASGLTRTYTIAFNDGTSQTFNVTDGRSITNIAKTRTNGLADTYTIAYNDGTYDEFTVTNGEKGEKGDNTYTHIKFAPQEPTEASHSIGDVPDKWIGFYWGSSPTAPTDWTQYKWYQFKGDKGDTGSPATLISTAVEYQVGNSGTIIPSEVWTVSVPVVAQGKYLWTRTTQTFNTGSPVVSYSVSRMGMDGAGSVVSVNGISPNTEGNVALTAEDVSARPNTWFPKAEEIEAEPASESAAHPGCYYRTVDGETEWINPPMVAKTEYRTTERYDGKPVYVYQGKEPLAQTLVANGSVSVVTNRTGISCVRANVKIDYYMLPYISGNGTTFLVGVQGNGKIDIKNQGTDVWNAGLIVYYTIYYTKN